MLPAMHAAELRDGSGRSSAAATTCCPALNDQGYYVGRVERNLYWVTDGV
jgi:hypothetical protein